MTNLSDLIQKGPISRAQRIVIYGPNGVGKSTLASQFPEAIFVDTEDGTTHLAVNRIPVKEYVSLYDVIKAITQAEYPYRTVVLDTIDQAELFLRTEVCKDLRITGMEAKPYGKAYGYLFEKFDKLLTQHLDGLIAAGIHVLIVGHTNIKRVQLPGLDGFDRYELKIHQSCAHRLREWSDAVLFADWRIHLVENEGKIKATGGKERVLHTQHSANHDAKVRVDLPAELSFGFSAIEPLLCGWQRPERKPPQVQLAEALDDIKPEQIRAFLIDRKQIQDDQDVTDVSAEYAREALNRLPQFRQAVQDFDFIPM